MDKFKYKLFMDSLETNYMSYDLDTFEESIQSLSPTDVIAVHSFLTKRSSTPEHAKHLADLLQILWHYQ